MVAMGALVGMSIGRLFIGGIVPGVLVGIFMLIISYIISKRKNYGRLQLEWSIKLLFKAFLKALGPISIPVIIVGGITSGVFTPTEASNIVVVLIMILGFIVYRNLTFRGFCRALRGTLYLLGPVMLVISAAGVFSGILIQQKAGIIVADALLNISKNPSIILLMISFVALFLGCFLEALAIMILIAPVVMPVIQIVGINPIHFGVVLVQALMIGLITPPVGISMFLTCSIAKITIVDFTRAIIPFFIVLVLALLISIFIPQMVLFLPDVLMAVG
jgi:C4-dicarboxylate transporter DctM subunit